MAHALVATREATVVHVYNTAMISKRVHFVQRESKALWVTACRVFRRSRPAEPFSRTNRGVSTLSLICHRKSTDKLDLEIRKSTNKLDLEIEFVLFRGHISVVFSREIAVRQDKETLVPR